MKAFFLIFLSAACATASALDPIRSYAFTTGLGDTLAGPDIEGNGGLIVDGRYRFAANQGLTLRDALPNAASYSVEVAMRIDVANSFYVKLLDFADLTADDGIYIAGSDFIFYPYTSDSTLDVLPGQDFVFVLTQDAQGATRGYIDGQLQFTIGGGGNATAADNVLHFLIDDTATSQTETASGSIDYLRIYGGALTQTQIDALAPPPPDMLGDTIFSTLSIGSAPVNYWNAVGQAPTAAVVTAGAPEYDAPSTGLFDMSADFEEDRLEIGFVGGINGGVIGPVLTFTDLGFASEIVSVLVRGNSFDDPPQTITVTGPDSVSLQFPTLQYVIGETFELALQFVTTQTDDLDGDGVAAATDNCLAVANDDQRDTDGDGFGNACDADINGDCVVNAQDLGLLRQAFFTTPASPTWNPDIDFNGDDVVNPQDLGSMRSAFFTAPGPSGTAYCD